MAFFRYSRLQKSCNTQVEQWKTTIDLPRMNLIIFPASARSSSVKTQQINCGFHCSACLLQDFHNLLYKTRNGKASTCYHHIHCFLDLDKFVPKRLSILCLKSVGNDFLFTLAH